MIRPRFLGAVLVGLIASPAMAVTVTYQEESLPNASYTSHVTDMRENIPTTIRNGTVENPAGVLFIGRIATDGTDDTRGLFGFPLTGIPAGSTIDSITLTLYGQNSDSGSNAGGAIPIRLHSLVGEFAETEASWANRVQSDTPTAWSAAGGDFSATVLTSTAPINPANVVAGQEILFPSSTDFVSAAQAALDGSGVLYLLAKTDESAAARGLFRLWTDDAADANAQEVTVHPKLTVAYTPVPEPGSFVLAGIACLGIVMARRTRRAC